MAARHVSGTILLVVSTERLRAMTSSFLNDNNAFPQSPRSGFFKS